MKLQARRARKAAKPEYSYDREHFRPLGLQLFLEKVRPTPMPLRDVMGAAPQRTLPVSHFGSSSAKTGRGASPSPMPAPTKSGLEERAGERRQSSPSSGNPERKRLPNVSHMVAPGESPDTGKVLETERRMFSLREGDNQNPYSWDFDLCSLTLGNFNYRKMTLVRDYAKLIETDMASGAFDTVFSLGPRPPEEAPPPLELEQQNLIISCDAAQGSAIARARTGASYIIQGPPGTGKSQTITNLIADYVARGKRVLFVCEKRAAIDVVFHRLRQQGLDELCCLIHDSQTDKKAFIQNLKQTYEQFLSQSEVDAEAERNRTATLKTMEQDLAGLRRFSEVMRQPQAETGIGVRSLLHRLVELRGVWPSPATAAQQRTQPHETSSAATQSKVAVAGDGHAPKAPRALPPVVEEVLPDYPLWLQHGEVVERLLTALTELGEELCFAKHPLRWLGKGVLEADRPIEKLTTWLDRAEDLLDAIESALELSGLPAELWDTFEEIQAILGFAVRAHPLVPRNLLGVLTKGADARAFDDLAKELETKAQALAQAQRKTAAWTEPLSPDDTQNALAQAQAFEKSIFRFLQPAFWRLRKTLQTRYDFAQHAVAPASSKILKDLAAQHEIQAALDRLSEQARKEWQTDDVPAFRSFVEQLRADRNTSHPSVKALIQQLAKSSDGGSLIENLAGISERFSEVDGILRSLLAEHQQFDFPELAQVLASLREQTGLLVELSPLLADLVELPEPFGNALRRVEVPLHEFEAVIGHKSLNQVYRQDRAVDRFDGRLLSRKMEQLEKHYRQWLALNARCLRTAVRRQFIEHVNVSSLPASQLQQEQKAFKKSYAAGRRDLEHEFGKTMRYKAIRELAAGDTGQVIRDLKPIWLMSPLSVSDTLPLDPDLFDVVIFDEASQIPLEEAIPAIYRSHQVIIVGDEMQLPPTTFFATMRTEGDSVVVEEEGESFEVDLDSDSFLTQSAQNLPSTLLAWHYRSRYESLISFSNAAFYSGNLFTIPDRQRAIDHQAEIRVTAPEQGAANAGALLARSISFHFVENGIYEDRTNPNEAAYIAQLVRALLGREVKLSIGIVAFSEAQQTELESALSRLADEDSAFAAQLEAEYVREENDVFCGLFVKNLENVQGDERDIIIMSVCYGHDPGGRMLMNFGPINQRGGEKRLNVIFSRAKHHMALVSSIRHHDVTNDYNDGANSLKNFLQYAEAVSKGDAATARRVLENLNPLSRQALAPLNKGDAVVEQLAAALRSRGHAVDINVGQSRFRCDLAVRGNSDSLYQLGILVDTDGHYANPNLLDRYLMQPSILRAFGWRFALVLTKDWYHNPDDVLARLEKILKGHDPAEEPEAEEDSSPQQEPVAEEPALPAATAASPSPVSAASPPQQQQQAAHEPSVPSVSSVPSSSRHLEFVGGSSRKFWEISVSENSFTVRFGRLGTAGQSQTKSFADESSAKREAEKLVAEKLRKGYMEAPG
jgi:predicted DNA-binding WGR domain protein